MKDRHKTKQQLIDELMELRQRNAELEASEAERKRTEEQLRIFSSAFEQSTNSIAVLDKEGVVEYVNPKLLDIYKSSPEDVVGKYWGSFVSEHSSLREKLQEIRDTVLKKGMIWKGEVTDRSATGETIWREATILPIKDEKGEIARSVYISEDITEHKRAEEIIRVQRDLGIALSSADSPDETLRLCTESAINISGMDCGGVYLVDKTSGELNLAFHKGLSPDFIEKASHYDADSFNAKLVMAGRPVYTQYDATGVPMDPIDYREGLRAIAIIPVQHEGQVIACLNTASHALDHVPLAARNALETMSTQIGNAIARAQVEKALQESQERHRTITNALSVGVYRNTPGPKGKFIEANSAVARMFGYENMEDFLAVNVADLYQDPEDRKAFSEELLNTGFVKDREILAKKKDGTPFICSVSAIAEKDENGAVICFDGIVEDVTERKRAEKELRSSEERLKILFEFAPDAYYLNDLTGRFVDGNRAAEELTGYTKEELIGKNFLKMKLLSPIQIPKAAALLAKNALGQPTGPDEFVLNRRDGSSVTAEIRTFPVKIEDQTLVLGIARDITQRRKAEEALRESEEKFRNLAEQSPNMIFINKGGRIVYANEKCEEITGYRKEEFYSPDFDFLTLIAPESRDMVKSSFSRHMKGEELPTYEYGLLTKEGKRLDVILTSVLIQYEGETAILGTVIDITERKLMLSELAAERESLTVTLRSIGDGVITTDVDGKIVLLNRAAETLTGWSAEEAVGKPIAEVFHIVNEDTQERCENPVEKVLKTGGIVGLANRTVLIAKDGTRRIIADSGAPIRDRDSNTIGVVMVFRDVTVRQKMESELLKTQKLESIGVLAGGIAHDLNNFLTAIVGNISLAMMHENPLDKDKRLTEAEKACMQIRDLTQQLLTFSKGGAPIKELATIEEILKDSATFALRGSDSRCLFSIQDDLWPVEVDSGQISQVVNNVVINADQAMPGGGTMELRAENVMVGADDGLPLKDGAYVKISIEDRGVGIPETVLQNVFDPFFTTKQKGSGLGLASSYSIIQQHDGHITVESQVGVGTTFHIYLPASTEHVLMEEEKEESKPIMGKGKVLVMDDEGHVRDMAVDMLTNLGYEATTAIDGDEAIKMYRQALESGNPFDAVIVDLTIPGGMGGRETIRRLIEIDTKAKAIVSSGYSNDPIMANFSEYGFKGFIAKPYRIRELSEVISKVIET